MKRVFLFLKTLTNLFFFAKVNYHSSLQKIKERSEKVKAKKPKKAILSFRAQLILYGFLLISIVSVPVFVVEIWRPWQELDKLIDQGKIIVSDVRSNFPDQDLQPMNNFALQIYQIADSENEDVLVQGFNMLVIEEKLLTEEEVQQAFADGEAEIEEFDYQAMAKAYQFWQEQFKDKPELLELFKKYKTQLMQKRE